MINDREKFLSALADEDREALARVFDKAEAARRSGRAAFTPFLSEREYSEFLKREKYVSAVPYTAFGGFSGANRIMLRFSGEEEPFPISAVKITGRGAEKLRHPDYLGSILSLGLERKHVGDIVKSGEECIVFAETNAARIIGESLTAVGGVRVSCRVCSSEEVSVSPSFEEVTGTVASLRADSVAAVLLNTSRSKAAEAIAAQRFYLNQILCTKCDKEIKENDIISVRGGGKARVKSVSGRSKKGRLYVTLEKYT